MPRRHRPQSIYNPAPAFSWTGGYVGGILGYGWGTPKVGGTTWSADGVTGGVFGGYNFQPSSNFVLGLETDITASGMSGKKAGVTVDNNWNGTIRGRAGFRLRPLHGVRHRRSGARQHPDQDPGGSKDTSLRTGYTVGGGRRSGAHQLVVGRLEYRYTELRRLQIRDDTEDQGELLVERGAGRPRRQVLIQRGVKITRPRPRFGGAFLFLSLEANAGSNRPSAV